MTPIDLVRLTALRDRTSGSPDVVVGLIDGPVAVDRPDLANENISPIPGKPDGACHRASSTACLHGTFVRRNSLCTKGLRRRREWFFSH